MCTKSPADVEIHAVSADRLRDGLPLPLASAAALHPGQAAWQVLEARQGGKVVGVIAGRLLPGKLGWVQPPEVASQSADVAIALQKALDQRLLGQGAQLLQATLHSTSGPTAALLSHCGYRQIAHLSYLVSMAESFPVTAPVGPLEFDDYQPADRDRLARILDATYTDTLDCPALNSVRPTQDVLDGYEQVGDRRWFFLIRHQQQDIGCLLIAEHNGQQQAELVYMGIVPERRGRGWGALIARFAQWTTRREGLKQMVLAVDSANQPALSMYESVGFYAFGACSVYIKAGES